MRVNLFKIYNFKLFLRIALFAVAIVIYCKDESSLSLSDSAFMFQHGLKPGHMIWVIFMLNMAGKFTPQNTVSMGCGKQFKSNYVASAAEVDPDELQACVKAGNRGAKKVLAAWVGVNAVVGELYHRNVIGQSEILLLVLFYYVCDLIAILYYCPFQALIMKNRCCVTCRIFNWDALMICTPLIFTKGLFSRSLVLVALVLLVRWEVAFRRHPARFFERSNANLSCAACKEKICKVKKPFVFRT
jgi:hypothetical protein